MSEDISVLVRTQSIFVDPGSGSVSIINSGPQGPPGAGSPGAPGEPGPPGEPPDWRGTWSSASVAYLLGDMVYYAGSLYISLDDHISSAGTNPQVSTAHWGLASRGFNWKGAWVSGTNYYTGDVSTFGGSTYFALSNMTTAPGNTTNPSLSANWEIMAAKGDALDPVAPADASNYGTIMFGVDGDLEGPADNVVVPLLRTHVDPLNDDPHAIYAKVEQLSGHELTTRPEEAHSADAVSVNLSDLGGGLTVATPDVQAALKALNLRSLPSNLNEKEKDFYFTGALSVGTNPGIYKVGPIVQQFIGARVALNTAATGADVVFTVRQNGSSTLHPMNPSVRSSQVRLDANASVGSANAPSLGVPGDTTVRVDDLLLMFVTTQATKYVPTPSGWTLVANINTTTLIDSGSRTYVFAKKATIVDAPASGSAPTYSISLKTSDLVTATTGRVTIRVVSVKEPYTASTDATAQWAIAVSNVQQTDISGTSFGHIGVTPTGPGHLMLLVAGVNQGTGGSVNNVLTEPAGMTLVGKTTSILTPQLVASLQLADDSRASSGIKTVTSSLAGRWAGVALSLRPCRPTVRAGQRQSDFEVGPSTASIFNGVFAADALASAEVDSIGDAGTTGADATLSIRIKDSV